LKEGGGGVWLVRSSDANGRVLKVDALRTISTQHIDMRLNHVLVIFARARPPK